AGARARPRSAATGQGRQPEHAVVDQQRDDGRREQQHRHGAGETPVQQCLHLLDDDLGDHRLAPSAASSAGVMKKPSEVMNTITPHAATPGNDSGKSTRQNTCPRLAPRVSAARIRSRGIPCMTANIVSTASGISAWLMPMMTPVRLNTSGIGASITPWLFST